MDARRITKLPRYTWKQTVKTPRIDLGRSRRAVFGFDTEYDSRTGELISVQLYRPGCEIFYPVPRRFRLTYSFLRGLISEYYSPFLVAFFSLADISKLADWWDAKLSETGLGMLMAEKGDLTIFDVGTYWSSDRTFSLRKLGKMIGREKLDWDRENVTRADLDAPGFRAYAMRDAEICYYAYDEFLRETIWRLFATDIVHYRSSPTVSSTIFRRRLKAPIVPPPPTIRSYALRSYWGGRAEIFRTGIVNGSIVEIDANSEYPRSAIALGALPDADAWCIGGDWREYAGGFVYVLFSYPSSWRGFYALPVYGADGSLFWPKTGCTWCTLAELQTAVRHCPEMAVVVRGVVGYRSGTRRELADYLTDLLVSKDAATGADRYVYKLMANSIIGKLAQNKRVTFDAEHIRKSNVIGLPPQYCPQTVRRERVEVGNCFIPEYASLILGKARAVLYDAMQRVTARRVLLCSTDSIIYKGDPAEFVIDGVPFEIEHTGTRLQIWREKVYALYDNAELVKVAHHALPGRALYDDDGNFRLDNGSHYIDVSYKEFVKLSKAAQGYVFGSVLKRTKRVTLRPSKW